MASDAAPSGVEPAPYRVAVVGAGGVGGYYAARLANTPGFEVHCVCRGATLEAIKLWGLRVTSIGGNTTARVASATPDPAHIGVVDLVIVALKTWQLAGLELRSLVGPRTLVLPTQNGVDTPAKLGELVGAEHVLGGYARITSLLVGPGEVQHTAIQPVVQGAGVLPSSGAWAGAELQRCAAAFSRCDQLRLQVDENVSLTMWQKLTTMAPYSTLCAVSRCPVGPLLQAPASRALMLDCMRETAAVARAVGVPMTEAHVQTALCILGGLPGGSTPSMARDFMAGRPSELDAQTGAVVRLAAAHGVAAPLLGALHAVLEPQERMHRGELRVADVIAHVPVDALPLEYYI